MINFCFNLRRYFIKDTKRPSDIILRPQEIPTLINSDLTNILSNGGITMIDV